MRNHDDETHPRDPDDPRLRAGHGRPAGPRADEHVLLRHLLRVRAVLTVLPDDAAVPAPALLTQPPDGRVLPEPHRLGPAAPTPGEWRGLGFGAELPRSCGFVHRPENSTRTAPRNRPFLDSREWGMPRTNKGAERPGGVGRD